MRTSFRRFLKFIALGAVAVAPLAANATNIEISGNVSYDVSGGQVVIGVDRVENVDSFTSNSLYLKLWATTDSDPVGSGYDLAVISLGALTPGEYYYGSETATFTAPPDGTYYLHLVVTESPNTDTIIDSVTFSGTETFGGGGSGGDGGGDSGGGGGDGSYISIEGNVSYDASGDTVYLEVDRVANNSSSTTSGTLYLKLWATTGSSPVGSGYTLASTELGTLAPGAYYYDITRTLDFDAPPAGTYYIHLIVTEYPNTDTILDSVTFPGTETFSGSGGGGGGGDPEPESGDGGGGAVHPALLFVLAGAVAGIRRRRAAA